MRESFNVKTV